jgi:hypothetical protein
VRLPLPLSALPPLLLLLLGEHSICVQQTRQDTVVAP